MNEEFAMQWLGLTLRKAGEGFVWPPLVSTHSRDRVLPSCHRVITAAAANGSDHRFQQSAMKPEGWKQRVWSGSNKSTDVLLELWAEYFPKHHWVLAVEENSAVTSLTISAGFHSFPRYNLTNLLSGPITAVRSEWMTCSFPDSVSWKYRKPKYCAMPFTSSFEPVANSQCWNVSSE